MKKLMWFLALILLTACRVTTNQPEDLTESTTNTLATVTNIPVVVSKTPIPVSTVLSTDTPQPTNETTLTLEPSTTNSSSPTDQYITIITIHMIDETSGWGMDDKENILHTEDGGRSWKEVSPPEENYRLDFALDADIAWAVPTWHMQTNEQGFAMTYDTVHIWRTLDGGISWQDSQPLSIQRNLSDSQASSVSSYDADSQFINPNTGWLMMAVDIESHMTYGWQVFYTEDGGKNWVRLSDSDVGNSPPSLRQAIFLDEQLGWAAGQPVGLTGPYKAWNAKIFKTIDGGKSWSDFLIPSPIGLPSDHELDCGSTGISKITNSSFLVSTECIVYDDNTNPHISFYHLTSDNGKTWFSWTGKETFLKKVDFINEQIGWQIVFDESNGFILEYTNNSGQSWQMLTKLGWEGDLYFQNELTGWAISLKDNQRILLFTNDGGKTWEEIHPILTR